MGLKCFRLNVSKNTLCISSTMLPVPMKAAAKKVGARPMTKGALAANVAGMLELKKTVASKLINTLASLGQQEMKKTGLFTIPGLTRMKVRTKPATKAGKREMFGKVVIVKAKPAKQIVKAFPAAALKKSI